MPRKPDPQRHDALSASVSGRAHAGRPASRAQITFNHREGSPTTKPAPTSALHLSLHSRKPVRQPAPPCPICPFRAHTVPKSAPFAAKLPSALRPPFPHFCKRKTRKTIIGIGENKPSNQKSHQHPNHAKKRRIRETRSIRGLCDDRAVSVRTRLGNRNEKRIRNMPKTITGTTITGTISCRQPAPSATLGSREVLVQKQLGGSVTALPVNHH